MRRTRFSLVLLFMASAALAQTPTANLSVAIIADATVPGGPALATFLRVPDQVTPEVPFEIDVFYGNTSATNAETDVVLTLGLPNGVRVVAVPQNCAQSGGVVTCQIGTVPPNKLGFGTPDFIVSAVAGESVNGQLLQFFTADIKGNGSSAHAAASTRVIRTFYVTDTAESLADTIDQANLLCTDPYPCKIAFRLGTPPDSGYFTIKPRRALPAVTGNNIFIDGSTQTTLTGDTNPNGPEIFIDGSGNESEDGIVFNSPCGGEIGSVAIGNFRNAAVTMKGEGDNAFAPCNDDRVVSYGASVDQSYLGVDPTGTTAAPNGRGVVISDRLGGGSVTNSLISGNRRSGIWMGRSPFKTLLWNTIGIDIHHQPLANGASGIYVGPLVSRLNIIGNYSAFNHDFGVAIDRKATRVYLFQNSIFANGQLGIDFGLDGPTPDRDIPAPAIVSAHYDPAQDKTIVVITATEPSNGFNPMIELFASDAPHPSGYGDGQYTLGFQDFTAASGGVTIAAKGDWRGKWVSATLTRNDFIGVVGTSEFSRAVKVE